MLMHVFTFRFFLIDRKCSETLWLLSDQVKQLSL